MAGYTRQSAASIQDGLNVTAAIFNAEYDALATAFGTGGHVHDGTTGNGPKLSLTGAVSGTLPIANGGTNGTTAATARTSLGLTNVSTATTVLGGTWTPVLKFGSGSTGITYSLQSGNYTRIGNLVYYSAAVILSSKGSSTGAVTFTGLPFTPPTQYSIGNAFGIAGMASWASAKVVMSAGSSDVALYLTGASSDNAATDANFTNSSTIIFAGVVDVGAL